MASSQTDTAPAPRRGRPPRVDRNAILEAALEIGVEELTMPALAQRLGVSTPALYHYFPSKEALLSAVASYRIEDLRFPDDPGDWKRWIELGMWRAFERFDDSPDMAQHLGAGDVSERLNVDVCNDTMRVFLDAGFSEQNARRAFDLTSRFLFRIAHSEEMTLGRIERRRPEIFRLEGADAMRRVSENSHEEDLHDRFANEVKCLIAGIEACFAPPREEDEDPGGPR